MKLIFLSFLLDVEIICDYGAHDFIGTYKSKVREGNPIEFKKL